MIVIDVETTGTDFKQNSIISIGAIELENPTNRIYLECKPFDGAIIDDYALSINGTTKDKLFDSARLSLKEALVKLIDFTDSVNNRTIVGQNVHFDLYFINHAIKMYDLNYRFSHRVFDQHSLCLASMLRSGVAIPVKNGSYDLDSDKIMDYVGIPREPKPHIAINGAIWEAEAIYRLLYGKNLLEEFKMYDVPNYLKI